MSAEKQTLYKPICQNVSFSDGTQFDKGGVSSGLLRTSQRRKASPMAATTNSYKSRRLRLKFIKEIRKIRVIRS